MPFKIDITASRRSRRRRRGHEDAPLLVRSSHADDHVALTRLAALDCRKLPAGGFLVAEVEGELVAALPLDADVPPLGDPFRRTADIVELLELRALSHPTRMRRAA